MAKISSYAEELSASPNGWLLMAVEQPDGSFHTKKVAPDKIGAQGGVGPQGPQGTNGADGVAGAAGPTGPAGVALLTGFGTPSSGLGSNFSVYFDRNNGDLYVKDSLGGWIPTTYPGLGKISAAQFSVVGGAGNDESNNISALFAFLEGLSGTPVHVLIQGTGSAPIQINKTLSLEADNVVLEFLSPVLFSGDGAIRLLGSMTEITPGILLKGKLAVNFTTSQLTMTLAASLTTMQASDFATGDVIVMRGQNDINGKALTKQVFHVLSVNAGLNQVTVAENPEVTFQPTYPGSDWPPDLTTGTTIALLAHAALTVDAAAGALSVTCGAAALAASGIVAGSVVRFYTNETEYDIDPNAVTTGAVPYKNTARLEYKKVNAVDLGTGIVTFDSPIVDAYAVAKYAGLTLINIVNNSEIRGIRASFSAAQTSKNIHAIQMAYCYGCRINNCQLDGSGGQIGNGIRASDCLECNITNSRVSNPNNLDSAEGYGFAIYLSDKVTLHGCVGEGCRHNYLVQKANHTSFDACVSINDAISGFDLHGVRSFHTHMRNCRCYGGPTFAPSVNHKSAFRIGNTSHACGDYDVLIENCYVHGCLAMNSAFTFTGAAFEMFGASHGVTVRGCVFSDCSVGARIGNNAQFDAQLNTNIVFDGNEFIRCTNPLDIDGESTAKDVRQIVFANNTSTQNANHFLFKYCEDIKVIGNRVLNPTASAGVYGYHFVHCDRLTVINNEAYGTNRGLFLDDCTLCVLAGNKWFAQVDNINFVTSGTPTYTDDGGRSMVLSSYNSTTNFIFKTTPGVGEYSLVPSSSAAPDVTLGAELIATTYTARQPGRLVKVHAVIPMCATGTANTNCVCHIFVDGVAVGTGQMRITATGAGSGFQVQAIGTFLGTGASQAITFRFGTTVDSITLTVGHEWTSGTNKTCTPFLIIEEAP